MPRYFAIILVLVLASYSIGHKVLTVPLTIQNEVEMQAESSTSNLNSDLGSFGLKDVDEEYVIYAKPLYVITVYIYLWFPDAKNIYEQRFILDLKAPWIGVHSNCYNCLGDDLKPQEPFKVCEEKNATIKFKSKESTGKVCNASITAVHNVPWFYAKDVKMIIYDYADFPGTSYANFEGVLGLAPSASSEYDSFVEVLKNQGIIDKASFNIDYRYLNSRYAVTFGGIDAERAPGLDSFTFTDLYDNTSWSLGISSMKYGELEFGGQAVKAVLDTQDNYIRLPPEDYKRWANQTTYGKPCSLVGTYYRCSCNANSNKDGTFDSMYISFGDYQYEVSPEHYVVVGLNGRSYYCNFYVYQSEDPSNSTVNLGMAFLQNYNIYYDLENMQVGIYGENVVYTGSGTLSHAGGDNNDNGDTIPKKSTTGNIARYIKELRLLTTLFILSLILNLIFICCCCLSRREKDEKDEISDREEPLLDPKRDSV